MSTALNCVKLKIFITAFFLVMEDTSNLKPFIRQFRIVHWQALWETHLLLTAMSVFQLFKRATTSGGSQFTFDELILLQETF